MRAQRSLLFFVLAVGVHGVLGSIITESYVTDVPDYQTTPDTGGTNKTKLPECVPEQCQLPQCFCNRGQRPGQLSISHTPQMVLFTFTGTVDKHIRHALTKLFPDSATNPNGCPVGITLFVEGDGTDYCAVHRMYVRGHEIATGGFNQSTFHPSWEEKDLETQYKEHRQILRDRAYLDKGHLKGMRARGLILGGDLQYNTTRNNHFLYDSSLIVQHPLNLTEINTNIWPFTFDVPLTNQNLTCHNFQHNCPQDSYPGLWEIPVSQLSNSPYEPCSFLEDCTAFTPSQVHNILRNNFEAHYNNSKLPFQVNLGSVSILDDDLSDGIKLFVESLLAEENTWMVTMQEAIRWMERPVTNDNAHDLWQCRELRLFNESCVLVAMEKETKAVLGDALRDKRLWMWQTLLLIVTYLVVVTYDRKR